MYHFPKKSIVGRAAVASIGWAKASFRSYVEMVDLTSENDFDAILREASIVLCDSYGTGCCIITPSHLLQLV